MTGMEDDFLKKPRLNWKLMAKIVAEKGTLVGTDKQPIGVNPVEMHKLSMIIDAGVGNEMQRIGDALERIADALEGKGALH